MAIWGTEHTHTHSFKLSPVYTALHKYLIWYAVRPTSCNAHSVLVVGVCQTSRLYCTGNDSGQFACLQDEFNSVLPFLNLDFI